MKTLRTYFFFFILSFLTVACQRYHDTTARFNAYFLAKEKMKETEQLLYGFPKDDYNQLLRILPKIDSSETRSQKVAFDYIIEKASIPIQFHETSKWVDDCYVLIGKARLYQEDYANAVSTFKYVYAKGKDSYAKHQALIWLMRTFLEARELNNFNAAKELLEKETEPLHEDNLRDYHLIMAQYQWEKENYDLCVQHLEYATPLIAWKDTRARYYFAMGQLYEVLNQPEKAYRCYQQTVRLSPPYDLWFSAKLKTNGLSTIVFNEKDMSEKELASFYQRLLKDLKNFDHRDKIYFEMAKHALQKGEMEKSLHYLNESIQVSTKNTTQKAHSYLQTAEIYYSSQRNFLKAAFYYDSALQSLPKTFRGYDKIAEKNEHLQNLAKHLQTIEESDKLLRFSQLSGETLDSALAAEVSKEKEQIIKQRENQQYSQQKKDRKIVESQLLTTTSAEETWYFYNPTAVIQGSSSFLRTWGNRPLEDHWRRSKRVMLSSSTGNLMVSVAEDNARSEEEDIFANVKSVEERKKAIPTTSEEQQQVRQRLEDAIFAAGKILMFSLKEPLSSFDYFERLRKDFPESRHTPEALYLMYQYCAEHKTCDPSPYKELLLNAYADSFYGKLLANPDHIKEINLASKDAEKLYKEAYDLYKKGNYHSAKQMVDKWLIEHKDHALHDKVRFLQLLIVGHMQPDLSTYQTMIKLFLDDFPKSPLHAQAEAILRKVTEELNGN